MPGPGVTVTTTTRSGATTPLRAASGQFFVSAITERGDTAAPILLRSMTDYATKCGQRTSYTTAYDHIKSYFDEGGVQVYVARIIGGSATVGTLTLSDTAGSPVATLRVDAQNVGAWSTQATVEVVTGSLTGSFRIKVRMSGEVVEDVNNLLTPAAAALAFAGSVYVRVVDLGSATAAPANNPALIGQTALSAGNDQRGSVVAADYVTGLARFNPELGDGAVAIPGQTATVYTGVIAHCKTFSRVALLAAARSSSTAALASAANAVTADGEYAGLFAPWVGVDDGAGGIRYMSPEGYVAGVRSRAHDAVGPWLAPAGEFATARSLRSVDQVFTKAESDVLDSAKVCAIRLIANTIRLYGWRSLSLDEVNYYLLKDRDFLNRIVVESVTRLEKYVFRPIDARGQLFSEINGDLTGMLDPFKTAGGLYPLSDPVTLNQIDPGYRVVTDDSVNPLSSIALNKVNARILVRISPTGQFIELVIVKVGFAAGL